MQVSYLCNSSVLGFPFIISNHLDNPDLWLFKPVSLQISSWVLAALCSADCKMASRERPFKHRYHPIWFTSLIKVIEFIHFLPALGALQCLQLIFAYVFPRVYNFYLWESLSDTIYFVITRTGTPTNSLLIFFYMAKNKANSKNELWGSFQLFFFLWFGIFRLCKPFPVSMVLQLETYLTSPLFFVVNVFW